MKKYNKCEDDDDDENNIDKDIANFEKDMECEKITRNSCENNDCELNGVYEENFDFEANFRYGRTSAC